MNWLAPVDPYCERVVPGFGAEPFNTLTGLVFLAVGIAALRRAPVAEDRAAAFALALVGLASAAQHGFAIWLTVWADIAANLLFLVLLGFLLLRRLAGLGVMAAGGSAVLAVAAAYQMAASATLRALMGPAADLFVILTVALFVAALAIGPARPDTARRIGLAVVVLAVGLPFRFLDHDLCTVWPLGTHGIWHLLNASATALVLSALARHKSAV